MGTKLNKRYWFYLSSPYFDEDSLKGAVYFCVVIVLLIKNVHICLQQHIAKVYDTILSIPGMNETVKIDMRISRKKCTAAK